MGGKRWPQYAAGTRKEHQGWDNYEGQPAGGKPPWRVWSGAYASPKASNRPQYDSIVLPTSKDKKISREEVRVDSRDSLLRREVQKALSQARKADNRVRKLRDEKDTREAQWAQYVKESREAYLKEKARYEGHLQRIDDEIKGTMETGKEASAQVQSLILNGPPAGSDAVRPMEEEDTSWDALIGAEPQLEPGFLRDAVLAARQVPVEGQRPPHPAGALMTQEAAARLLQMAMAGLPQAVSQGGQVLPAAPPPGLHPTVPIQEAPPPTFGGHRGPDPAVSEGRLPDSRQPVEEPVPTAYNSMSPGPASHRAAPYPPASPTQPPPVEVTEAATEEHHLEHGQPRPAQPKIPRQDIKSATKSPPVKPSLGSTDMQTKLEAKRTQARDGLAMRPFGGRPTAPTDQPGQARDSDAAQRPPAGLIDDDLDTTACPTGEALSHAFVLHNHGLVPSLPSTPAMTRQLQPNDPPGTGTCRQVAIVLDLTHVGGNLCHFIVAVSEVPSPEVTGGIRRGEDIHVEGSTTLLLFAEEIGEEAMDSDSSVPENTPASSSSADVEDIQHQAIQPAVAAQEHPLPGVIEVAQEDPWGQEPPLTMLGLDLFDPTLPQGHNWNANSVVPFSAAMGDPISPAKQNPHGAGDSADNLSRRDDAPITAPVKLQILVYVPDFVPEIVEVEMSLPAAIETLLAKLRLARPPEQASSFSILSPASPQPLRSLAIFVAGFDWKLIGNAFVGVQELADSYHNMCPVGHVVSLEGARLEYRGEEQVFVVQHGQILTVEFVPESLDAGSEDPPPESPDLSVPQALPDVATGTQPAPTTAPSTAGDMSADMALDRARHATRLLGDAWPRPPYRWPIDDVSEDVEVLQEATPSEHVTIDIVVYLLTPDYHPEKLDLTVQLPQTVEELVDLVQTCRDQARHCLFPTLVEVIQQPDPGWALFLALPPWPRTRAVVCMDLSFFDGRVFANTVPEQPDFDDLCEAAGLGPVAEVDIFIPGLHEPLQHGIRIDLQTGMTIVFMMQGVARPPPF
ncbi:hypothetical protein AK812_SmicGene20101, partial [Symbiodinium microadriaticum]